MTEVLSPAGSWDALKAAVEEGADAVYFGFGSFNARRRGQSFTRVDVRDLVSFCHDKGVRAYLAANTLVKNHEMPTFFEDVSLSYEAGVDAVILQELSFTGHLKEVFPDLGVHASTQAGVFNRHYAKLLKGVDRVILPRELSLKQIGEFMEKVPVEVEVFVQGALCFSVSGQCLMSSFLGGRSGNRGICAQPCRKKYNGSYLLSTRDLCAIEDVKALIDLGVTCLKIEGRLRSPEYVGAATAVYRSLVDLGRADPLAVEDMMLAFNREYTRGGLGKKLDVVTPDAGGKRGVHLGRVESDGSIRLKARVFVGDGVAVKSQRFVHGDMVRKIVVGGASLSSAEAGQIAFLYLNAKTGEDIFITSGIRRRKKRGFKTLDKIGVMRNKAAPAIPEAFEGGCDEFLLLAKAYSPKQAITALESGADKVFYNVFERDYPGGDVMPYVPRCLVGWSAERALSLVSASGADSVLCADLGVASSLEGMSVHLDLSCNAFNDIDVGYYNSLGLEPLVSPELSFDEISSFKDRRFAFFAHGRLPLMSTKYVLNHECLKDEKGYVFPTRRELDYTQVLNSVPHGVFGGIGQLMKAGIRHYIIDLWGEPDDIVTVYKGLLSGGKAKRREGYTMGNYKKGVS